MNHRGTEAQRDILPEAVIGAAIKVHRALGPGLLESAYETCLCYELGQVQIHFLRQLELPVTDKGTPLDCGYRFDIVVSAQRELERKAVERLVPVHEAQSLTYLKPSKLHTGLLLNFNVPVLRNGIKRIRP
ncbi:MAG: GxxExxY protein [Thiobacillus sp.]|nr:GxxExxY protein [Thiobacillus sp.]